MPLADPSPGGGRFAPARCWLRLHYPPDVCGGRKWPVCFRRMVASRPLAPGSPPVPRRGKRGVKGERRVRGFEEAAPAYLDTRLLGYAASCVVNDGYRSPLRCCVVMPSWRLIALAIIMAWRIGTFTAIAISGSD